MKRFTEVGPFIHLVASMIPLQIAVLIILKDGRNPILSNMNGMNGPLIVGACGGGIPVAMVPVVPVGAMNGSDQGTQNSLSNMGNGSGDMKYDDKKAPIDPAQLLKALDSLLSVEGGIRSIEDVPRLASLMKKFSKKLVSRCVYCNVLQATKPEILSEYLDKGGWETRNIWLQYAKSSSSPSFLIERLKLCKLLSMTLNRLKENNTAKLIKSLAKHENNDVKELSNLLVNQWMSIIKEKKNAEPSGEKKKDKPDKPSKAEKVEPKVEKIEPTKEVKSLPKPVVESPKFLNKLRNLKRTSLDKERKPAEMYEDVKIDPEPLMPVPKEPRSDRPKTVKIYQKKFRATGLEVETPLPKNIKKNTSTVDKSAVAAAKSTLKLNTTLIDRITEKKIKPESLMAVNENANTKGIKLIPPKPCPTYVVHESTSFIDALISQPVAPIKRKKKTPSVHDLELAVQDLWTHLPQDNIRCLINSMPDCVAACIAAGGGQRAIEVALYLCRCTPCIRLIVLILRSSESLICIIMCIKFHFNPMLSSWVAIFNVPECTLEEKMSENKTEENKAEEPEQKEDEIQKTEDISENSPTIPEETVPIEVTEEGGHTPPNEEIVGNQSPDQESGFMDEVRLKAPFDPNNLRSILLHGKKRGRKKTVSWVEDSNIKEVFYFEMDDTERVNVSRSSNFYDLKFIEMKREREVMEMAKRQAGDRVEEFRKWWHVPILLDLPPLVVPGCQSQENTLNI